VLKQLVVFGGIWWYLVVFAFCLLPFAFGIFNKRLKFLTQGLNF